MIAFFDFDGTITTKDSLFDFIKYAVGKPLFYLGVFYMILMLVAYKLKFLSNNQAKEKFIAHFFKEWDADRFQIVSEEYSQGKLYEIINDGALKKMKWHIKQGHKVVVVSASIECWIKPWTEKQGVDLIATKLEIIDGKLSGKFATPNCFGMEKVNRIKEVYNLSEYKTIFAYGDSSGDKEMLAIANKKFYKSF